MDVGVKRVVGYVNSDGGGPGFMVKVTKQGLSLEANSYPLAVGLVSIPGMMTGQILSGISPLIATRYQVIVMCMVFGSAGISTAIFLTLCKGKTQA